MTTEVTDIEIGTSSATEEVHFSGGLRGFPTDHGWALFPISDNPDSNALVFQSPQSHHRFATQECGLHLIGTSIRYELGNNSPPMNVWEPRRRDPSSGLNAADSWGAIAHQASSEGDNEYANFASYVSVCLKVSGLRLRDISNKYHDQLKWALGDKNKAGTWFSNHALLDLYADFHSLVSEMSSARDHLAKIAAIHVGAHDRIDSLARLEDWIARPKNSANVNQPFIRLLTSVLGAKDGHDWLRRLGEVRNEMLHRIPMGANKSVSGLTLQEINTSQGIIKSIRLAEPLSKTPLSRQGPDPLTELSQISSNLEHLCRAACRLAKYPIVLPQFKRKTPT